MVFDIAGTYLCPGIAMARDVRKQEKASW